MKKSRGFTLIELLIVTVVIVTLMSLVFRLAGSGSGSSARATTLARLQKISNALSGYYAAFGSYPPVPLQGRSRDIYTKVDTYGSLGYGIQAGAREAKNKRTLTADDTIMRNQIEAACRAQPLAAGYPYNQKAMQNVLDTWSKQSGGKNYGAIANYGGFNRDSSDWSENNAFIFGLMSFLLPRYSFMLDGDESLYDSINHPNGPWATNNRLPFLIDGRRLESWTKAQEYLHMGPKYWDSSGSANSDKRAMIENLASQAVCARWMPNFAGIVTGGGVFFGVDTRDSSHPYLGNSGKEFLVSQKGYGHEPSYIGGVMTVRDGWDEDFYYYSPPPYQSYQLWSSGPDKRTFPPWMDKSSLQQGEIKLVNEWISDDIKVGDK